MVVSREALYSVVVPCTLSVFMFLKLSRYSIVYLDFHQFRALNIVLYMSRLYVCIDGIEGFLLTHEQSNKVIAFCVLQVIL